MQLKTSIKSLITLAIPIIMGQIGQMLIGAGDVYIASMYSTTSVAAIGVANGVFNPMFLFGIGLMMGVSPALAIIRGKGEDKQNALFSIIMYALISGFAITLVTLVINQFVPYMGFAPVMIPSIQAYINIVSWSIPFAIVFQGVKEYLQAYEDVFFPNIITIFAVFLNLATNYVLVFGLGSFEGYGEIGLALASLIIRVLLCVAILLYVFKRISFKEFSLNLMRKIFKFSLPIAFMFFLEVLAFCTVTILSGNIGVIAAAANNIIMTLASIAFMVPLSISSAVAVKVGHAYGQSDILKIKEFTLSAISITGVFILISASSFFIFPNFIMSIVSKDQLVIDLGIKLLFIVAIFQISDAMQVVLAGVLRGLKYTKVSSLMIFVGYWVLGIPTGYYLAFYADQGAVGLWIGLALSLTFCAIFLATFTKIKMKSISKPTL